MVDYIDEEERLKQEAEYWKQQYEKLQQDIQNLYLDPEAREHLKVLGKKLGVEIDDPPHEKAVKQDIKKLEKKIEELEAEKKQKKIEEYNQKLQRLYQEYGITTKEEAEKLNEFIKASGVIPSTIEGWEKVLRDYRASQITSPSFVRPNSVKEIFNSEEFMKNPKEAFYKYAENALKTLAQRR